MSDKMQNPMRGRGASDNPVNRFEGDYIDYDLNEETGEKPKPDTRLYRDDTKSVISYNNSEDISFDAGINPYRGCEHGCIYCYARPYHEFLGFSSGLDFESRIMVKYDAPELLRKTMSSEKWEPKVVAMSGATDIYQPVERELELTRACLEVFRDFRNPVSMITKNRLITRDLDILCEMNKYQCIQVTISVTTLDKHLCNIMEPRTTRPAKRIETIRRLSEAGIPVTVNVAPVIPGLTDHEIPEILSLASAAGAKWARHIMLRLPYKVKDMFAEWLQQHMPDRKDKILNRITDIREGKLNSTEWGERMKGKGKFAEQISDLFHVQCRKSGLNKEERILKTDNFIRKKGNQLNLF